jgi:hypothetical protein
MYILIVTNDKDQEIFYGPFNDGEQALDWAVEKFNTEYTLAAVPLCEPIKNNKINAGEELVKRYKNFNEILELESIKLKNVGKIKAKYIEGDKLKIPPIEEAKARNNEIVELANDIINSANEYYEVENPDEKAPVILENIVLSASRILKILESNNE